MHELLSYRSEHTDSQVAATRRGTRALFAGTALRGRGIVICLSHLFNISLANYTIRSQIFVGLPYVISCNNIVEVSIDFSFSS